MFPQGMLLFICPAIGLPGKSVEAQLYVSLNESGASKCMAGSTVPAGVGLLFYWGLSSKAATPLVGPIPQMPGAL